MLKLSYIGYEPLSLKVNDSKDYYSIALKKSTLDLMEVEVLPGVNPADVIMEKAVALDRAFRGPLPRGPVCPSKAGRSRARDLRLPTPPALRRPDLR